MARHLADGNVNVLVQWGPAKESRDFRLCQARGSVDPGLRPQRPGARGAQAHQLQHGDRPAAPDFAGCPARPCRRLAARLDETMRDAEFLAEAKRLKMDIKPMAGREFQTLATEVAHATQSSRAPNRHLRRRLRTMFNLAMSTLPMKTTASNRHRHTKETIAKFIPSFKLRRPSRLPVPLTTSS